MRPRLLPPHRLGLSLLATLVGGALVGGGVGPAAVAQTESPGAKGAQIYCYMRASGNTHAVSWAAAYALIKRQSASLFKTSPTHAAVMITEAVVQNPGTFPDCGKYLGSLFEKSTAASSSAAAAEASPAAPGSGQPSAAPRSDRYAY